MATLGTVKPSLGFWIDETSLGTKTVCVALGVALLSVLAQISIPVPYTPVPITGQTFGVALLSLLLGRKWGFTTVATYVVLGSIGFPIFSGAQAGIKILGAGYLVGMCVAALVIGTLSDKGWVKTFPTAFLACLAGSLFVFTCGIIILSNFVPANSLIAQGVLPFIPGDLIKSALAAAIATGITKNTSGHRLHH